MRRAGPVVPVALVLAAALPPRPVRHAGPRMHRAIAYFDWDRYPEQRASRFGDPSNEVHQHLWVHPQDLQSAGLLLEDVCRSTAWYDLAFATARRAGFDTLAWETYSTSPHDSPTRPQSGAASALRRHGLKVAPLIDWEIGHTAVAELACDAYVAPHESSADALGRIASVWAASFDPELRRMENGRPIAFVFSYGFSRQRPPSGWDPFFAHARAVLAAALGGDPIVYWTRSRTSGFLHAMLHEGDWIRPFAFLAGGMQGPDCITTSLWFDNDGAARRDRITRVERMDPAMAADVRALLASGRPRMVFHYALNEMLEGADLLPLHPEGPRRTRFLRALLATRPAARMPEVRVVTDDLCHPEERQTAPERRWRRDEEAFVLDVLPALLPFHRLMTREAALAAGPAEGPTLVLAFHGSAELPGASLDYAAEAGAQGGGAFDAEAVRRLIQERWRLSPRPASIFGRPESKLENARYTGTDGTVEVSEHRPLTFLPGAP